MFAKRFAVLGLVAATLFSAVSAAPLEKQQPALEDIDFEALPLELQDMITKRSVSTPGCWEKTAMREGAGANVCPEKGNYEVFMNRCLEPCPDGMKAVGNRCFQGMKSVPRSGVPAMCPPEKPNREMSLCFENCQTNFSGVGPLCVYKYCPAATPFKCGLGCVNDFVSCTKVLMEYARLGARAVSHIAKKDWAELTQDMREAVATVMAWQVCPMEQ